MARKKKIEKNARTQTKMVSDCSNMRHIHIIFHIYCPLMYAVYVYDGMKRRGDTISIFTTFVPL